MYMDKILMTVLISMAPVAELRAAIPFAVTQTTDRKSVV